MDNAMCNRIVEHIKMSRVEFDTQDLEEDLLGVIGQYGWFPVLSEEERQVVLADLLKVALDYEVAEIVRSMNVDEFIVVSPEVVDDE